MQGSAAARAAQEAQAERQHAHADASPSHLTGPDKRSVSWLPPLVHLSQELPQEALILAKGIMEGTHASAAVSTLHAVLGGGLSRRGRRWEGMLGGDAMMHVKKLRLLQRKGDDISKSKLLEKTRKYLDVIGTRISSLCSAEADPSAREDLHSDLWQARPAGSPL